MSSALQETDGKKTMKRFLLSCLTIVICLGFMQAAAPESDSGKPEYTSDNQLLPPKNFREWIFLSSGLGMSYNPGSMDHVMFTNVFVPQWAYKEFMGSGKWPDKTMFVVEDRMAQTNGSINKTGHFQVDSMGFGAEVKDSSLADKWAYYSFDGGEKSAARHGRGFFFGWDRRRLGCRTMGAARSPCKTRHSR